MGKNMKMPLEFSVRLRYLHQGKGAKICEGTFKIEYLPARKGTYAYSTERPSFRK